MYKGKLPKDIVTFVKQPAQLLQRDEDGGVREVGTVAHKGTPLPHVTTNQILFLQGRICKQKHAERMNRFTRVTSNKTKMLP
jgi:hypothetical protein